MTKTCWSRFGATLKNALQLSDEDVDSTLWPGKVKFWAWFWAFLILLSVSFGLLTIGDKLNSEGLALTRFMARAQAPITGQFVYPATAREQITVVLYDQQYLQDNGSAWPLTYQEHADALLRLAANPVARPRAILLDITFGQQRNDPTITQLDQALCTLQNDYKVPVFLAALPSPVDGRLKVRDGLGKASAGDAAACFTLVGVDYLPDALDGVAWTYALTRHRAGSGWADGPADDEKQVAYRSAALAMSQDTAGLALGKETVPMALVWGHNSAVQPHPPIALKGCRIGQSRWSSLPPGFLLDPLGMSPPEPALCPYHRTVSMAQLGELADEELVPLLKNRYVMVGANVPGYNDFANSPVHGILPGIHMHAMALDNLLTYGDQYKLSAEWSLTPPRALLLPGLLAVGTVFLVHALWRWGRRRAKQLRASWVREKKYTCITKTLAWFEAPSPPFGQRVAQLAGVLLGWVVRLVVQTLAAFAMLAVLQYFFRIGMLPVAELIGMTLVAEGLGAMKKISELVPGKPPRPSSVPN